MLSNTLCGSAPCRAVTERGPSLSHGDGRQQHAGGCSIGASRVFQGHPGRAPTGQRVSWFVFLLREAQCAPHQAALRCGFLRITNVSDTWFDMNSALTSRNNRMWLCPSVWKLARATIYVVFSYPVPR